LSGKGKKENNDSHIRAAGEGKKAPIATTCRRKKGTNKKRKGAEMPKENKKASATIGKGRTFFFITKCHLGKWPSSGKRGEGALQL